MKAIIFTGIFALIAGYTITSLQSEPLWMAIFVGASYPIFYEFRRRYDH